MKTKKIITIISIYILVIILMIGIGWLIIKPSYVYEGYCCEEISPEQDPDYNCSCNEIGCLCFNEKLNESCACVDGGCICN